MNNECSSAYPNPRDAGSLLAQAVQACLLSEAGEDPSWPSVPEELQQDFVRVVAEHRVTWTVNRHAEWLGLSETASADLANLAAADVMSAMRVQVVTVELLAALAEAGIRALVYKGVALAVMTTGDAAARGASDIDILVDPGDMRRLHETLLHIGADFVAGYSPPPTSELWKTVMRVGCEIPYRWRGVALDVHWRIDRLPQIAAMTFEDLWRRRESVTIAGVQIATLGEVDALLITAAHGTKEHWRHLRWVVDFVRQSRVILDWPTVLSNARHTGCEPGLAVGVAVARHLDPQCCPMVPSARVRELGERAWTRSLEQTAPFGGVNIVRQVERLTWKFETLPPGAIEHAVMREAIKPMDMAEVTLPRRLVWAYPLIRPALWGRRLITGAYGPGSDDKSPTPTGPTSAGAHRRTSDP